MKNKVVLLYNGSGIEKEVSQMTSQNVQKALKELNIDFLSLPTNFESLQKLKDIQPEKIFLAVHGPYGEDGILQGFLENLKIPYTGSGVLSSALCMDKIFFKKLMKSHQVLIPSYETIHCSGKNILEKINKPPFLPCVVKPSRSGSSIGIHICHSIEDWKRALKSAVQIDSQIIVEQYIQGVEVAVPWLDGKALTPVEIEPSLGHFYDFKRKYVKNQTKYFVPPRLKPNIVSKLKNITQKIQHLCQVHSYCRADFIVDEKNIYLLELNTLPGLTPLSLLPKSAQYEGIVYKELILKILNGASLDYFS